MVRSLADEGPNLQSSQFLSTASNPTYVRTNIDFWSFFLECKSPLGHPIGATLQAYHAAALVARAIHGL